MSDHKHVRATKWCLHRYQDIPDPDHNSELSLPLVTVTDFKTGEAGKETILLIAGEHARQAPFATDADAFRHSAVLTQCCLNTYIAFVSENMCITDAKLMIQLGANDCILTAVTIMGQDNLL